MPGPIRIWSPCAISCKKKRAGRNRKKPVGRGRLPPEPLALAGPEAAGLALHGEEIAAGRCHAQPRGIGGPDAGGQRLHQPVEGLAAEPPHHEALERFVLIGGRPQPRRHEPLPEQPQPPGKGKQRRREDRPQAARCQQPEPARGGHAAAGMPDERPPRGSFDADQFRVEAQPPDQGDSLGTRGQEAVGRPLHEPAVLAHGAEHAPDPAARLDHRHPP
jgi:hypothetical protein